MNYMDQSFCQHGDKNSEKCKKCFRYLDKEKYEKACDYHKFKIPIAYILSDGCLYPDTQKETTQSQTTEK